MLNTIPGIINNMGISIYGKFIIAAIIVLLVVMIIAGFFLPANTGTPSILSKNNNADNYFYVPDEYNAEETIQDANLGELVGGAL